MKRTNAEISRVGNTGQARKNKTDSILTLATKKMETEEQIE
jgi:hypothetical protein